MSPSTYPERDYDLGPRLLALRTASHLTQAALPDRLGVSRRAVVDWEAGASYPSPQHLQHLIELCLQHSAFHAGREAAAPVPGEGTSQITGNTPAEQ